MQVWTSLREKTILRIKMPRNDTLSAEDRLLEYTVQNDTDLPPYVDNFLHIVRVYSTLGLGYGLMLQLIEWEWQSQTGGLTFGLEALNHQIKDMSDEISDLKALLAEHDIEIPTETE